MATLVQFLVAGVKGAENGSATFLLRGTASSAASVLFNDFERTAQPGTNIITLDANGAAEVYCSAYVDVVLKTSTGTTLRTVTVGNSSSLVEVRSTSFKGDDYDGSPSNTVSQPITLTAVLNEWITSAGGTNFKVLVNGVEVNLQAAIAGFAGMFVNVKDPTYGALGDGVTNDTTAVAAAITAAAGGVVFFPPGTYVLDQIVPSTANLNLVGPGATLSLHASSSVFAPSDNTQSATKSITGFRFIATTSATRFVQVEDNQNFHFKDCRFETANITGEAVTIGVAGANKTRVFFDGCVFILDSGTSRALRTTQAASLIECYVSNCSFLIPASFTGRVLSGAGFYVDNCVFDGSAVTSGAYYHISPEDAITAGTYVGSVSNCKFVDGGSTGFVFKLTSILPTSNFVETGNTFSGFTAATLTGVGHIYDLSFDATDASTVTIVLGSRKGKSLAFTNAASSNILPTCQVVADTIVINHTNASNLTVQAQSPKMPPGAEYCVFVNNNSGGARTISFLDSGDTRSETTVPDGGYAYAHYRWYLETTGAERCVCDVTRQGSV